METNMSAVAALVPMASERRSEHRISQCFRVDFQVLSGNAALGAFQTLETRNSGFGGSSIPDKIPAMAENLSYGGLGITGDLDLLKENGLEQDSFLDMELEIPGVARKLRCQGTVAWIKREEAANVFRAGVSFLAIDQEDLSLVHGTIRRLSAPWRWA